MVLPGSYVAEHVALSYASTVHAAQGLTVDTCHTVTTPATGAEALYVGMSRGRDANTAYVTTRAVPADAPIGHRPSRSDTVPPCGRPVLLVWPGLPRPSSRRSGHTNHPPGSHGRNTGTEAFPWPPHRT